MSAAQATDFLTHWEIVSQQSNTSSGFSATVFKRKDADPSGTYQMGQYVFAVRGSETFSVLPPEVDWFSADFGEIGGLGIALHQPSSVGSYIQAGRHLQRALLRLKAHKLNFAGFFNASGCGLMLAYGAHAIIFN